MNSVSSSQSHDQTKLQSSGGPTIVKLLNYNLNSVVIAVYGNTAAMEECYHYVRVFLIIKINIITNILSIFGIIYILNGFLLTKNEVILYN